MGVAEFAEMLKGIRWDELGTHLVILYGLALRKANPQDIDLFIFVKENEEEVALKVMEEVERAAGPKPMSTSHPM